MARALLRVFAGPADAPAPAPAPAASPPSPSPDQCFLPEKRARLSPAYNVCCRRTGVFDCVEECREDIGCCKPYGNTFCYDDGPYVGGVCSSWGICSWVAIILAVIALLLLSVCCVSTMMTR